MGGVNPLVPLNLPLIVIDPHWFIHKNIADSNTVQVWANRVLGRGEAQWLPDHVSGGAPYTCSRVQVLYSGPGTTPEGYIIRWNDSLEEQRRNINDEAYD